MAADFPVGPRAGQSARGGGEDEHERAAAAAVTFRGELRTTATADGRAGLALRAPSLGRSTPPRAASPDPWEDPASHFASATPGDRRVDPA